MNGKKSCKIAWLFELILNADVTVLAVVGCVISSKSNGAGMLRFYTVDSNLLGAAACAVSVFFILRRQINGKAAPDWAEILKYVAVCCLMVTFLVVVLVLAPMFGGASAYRAMLTQGDMLYHHLLCPLLILLSFLLFDRVPVKTAVAAGYAVIPTLLYAAVTVTLNILGIMEGPYPFLRVYDQPVWVSCVWFIVILVGAFGLAALLCALQTRLHKGRLEQDRAVR